MKKDPGDRSSEETQTIRRNKKVVTILEKRAHMREINRQKSQEVEDTAEELEAKVAELAKVIRSAERLVVYTGAGISTAASIPDYRGPNGVWTLFQQGKESSLRNNSLVDAEPTLTHMALARLVQEDLVKHIVSQNCDGLHLRSGVPTARLSELHGNMYIEVCLECDPERQYIRLFDVTEHTSLRRHKTSRQCCKCGESLRDTIVHFGEKGVVVKPLNWSGAMDAAEEADAIVCLGSSLKVLRRYQCLWSTDRPKSQRPRLYIVNLQWTPKDSQATLKIHGRCDDVMSLVMKQLQLEIPSYSRSKDPIFKMVTPLRPDEETSYTTKSLSFSTSDSKPKGTKNEAVEQAENSSDSESTIIFTWTSAEADTLIKTEKDCILKDQRLNLTVSQPQEGGIADESKMPGWFGKGCRKKVIKRVGKKRRRSRVSSVEAGT